MEHSEGEIGDGENPLASARRAFEEELGFKSQEPFLPLGSVKQKSGKLIHGWAFCGDCDSATIQSNLTKLEWPPKSGREEETPEIDRAEFFSIAEAVRKINPAQVAFLRSVEKICSGKS